MKRAKEAAPTAHAYMAIPKHFATYRTNPEHLKEVMFAIARHSRDLIKAATSIPFLVADHIWALRLSRYGRLARSAEADGERRPAPLLRYRTRIGRDQKFFRPEFQSQSVPVDQ